MSRVAKQVKTVKAFYEYQKASQAPNLVSAQRAVDKGLQCRFCGGPHPSDSHNEKQHGPKVNLAELEELMGTLETRQKDIEEEKQRQL